MSQTGASDRSHHHSHTHPHTISVNAHPHPSVVGVAVRVNDLHSNRQHVVVVPGRSSADAERFLGVVGSGSTGTGAQDVWLGMALPSIRNNYSRALQAVEREIAQRRVQAGSRLKDAAEMEKFAKWAVARRNAVARIWRVPAGPGGMLGGEIRDMRTYGPGGRSLPNLLARAERNYGETGVSALERIVGSASKPNPAETAAILRGAKYLKAGGAVLFIGGVALTAYDIYKAPEGQRVDVAKTEGVSMAGGIVGSNLAVGVCFFLGMTGVGLIAVGLVAGVAGAYAAEKLYYAHTHDHAVRNLCQHGESHLSRFRTAPN